MQDFENHMMGLPKKQLINKDITVYTIGNLTLIRIIQLIECANTLFFLRSRSRHDNGRVPNDNQNHVKLFSSVGLTFN